MRITLSRRGDYAVRAALALAEQHLAKPTECLSTRRIAARMRIPSRFAAHVLTDLVRAGLIRSSPGRTGGYRLARAPESISLLHVVDAAEGEPSVSRCVLRGIPCDTAGHCAVHETIARTTSAARAELSRTTLGDLVGTRGL
jgi:Rrf2 family protein